MSAAPDLKRVTLELGGNDRRSSWTTPTRRWCPGRSSPAPSTTTGRSARPSSGSMSRGPPRRRRRGAGRLRSTVKVGDGTTPSPSSADQQRAAVRAGEGAGGRRHLGGARPVTGGHAMDRPGYFFEPTILADITDGTRIVDEEQFGPACRSSLTETSTTHWSGEQHPLRALGLGVERGPRAGGQVASELECGTAWVNTHLALAPQQPSAASSGAAWRGERAVGPLGVHRDPGALPLARGRWAERHDAGLVS